MAQYLCHIRADLTERRSDRIGLAVLAALGLALLAVLDYGIGRWGLLFLCGALLSTAIIYAATRSERWRKPILIAAALSLPAWLVAAVLPTTFAPAAWNLLPPLPGSSGSRGLNNVNHLGAFVYGVVTTATVGSPGQLMNPRHSRHRRR